MKPLGIVPPTPEQLTVINDDSPGYWLIRGAAGSGKTTTALLRLRFLVAYWRDRQLDLGLDGPVRILVLTFNKTLRGYIQHLVSTQVTSGPDVVLEVKTFAQWAQGRLHLEVVTEQTAQAKQWELAVGKFPSWSERFLTGEVDYLTGRFAPEDYEQYLTTERTGRGTTPRVDRATAGRRLLDEVVAPYVEWKRAEGVSDWADVAHAMAIRSPHPDERYDVVVVDEAQDFSANQVRAIRRHLSDDFVCTFIRDSTQRIYPNYFAWAEVGIGIPAGQNKRLEVNHRNTKQVAAFTRPLVDGIETIEDSNLPDFSSCVREGPVPTVVRGLYSAQVDWTISYLRSGLISADETIAFLHPLGWFNALKPRLDHEQIPYCTITRKSDWPQGSQQVALSTMSSAKGLEFDHVIILGYSDAATRHGAEAGDSMLEYHRRLLAMAIGRAKKSVTLGYKPDEASDLIDLLNPATYTAVDV